MTRRDERNVGPISSMCGLCGLCSLLISFLVIMVLPGFLSYVWPLLIFGIVVLTLSIACMVLNVRLKRKRSMLRRGKKMLQIQSSIAEPTPIKPVTRQLTQDEIDVPIFCPMCGKK